MQKVISKRLKKKLINLSLKTIKLWSWKMYSTWSINENTIVNLASVIPQSTAPGALSYKMVPASFLLVKGEQPDSISCFT